MNRLKNKRAPVSGGTSGSLETARQFLTEGAQVAITPGLCGLRRSAQKALGIFQSSQLDIGGDAMAKTTTNHGVQSMNYHVASVVDGSAISVRQWLPPAEVEIKAVVQLTHGISEHSGRYDRLGRHLAENGYRVYASDLRGHGLSVPQTQLGQASIHFWADTTADMKQLLDIMRTENPTLPRFAFGHSLGSALTQAHIQAWGGTFALR
jgi:predicted alpha/beta-fold hydrolase